VNFADFPIDQLSAFFDYGFSSIDIDRMAQSKATILITGERGSGKELFARYIHYKSQVAPKPFISINCAGKSEIFLENELFGNEIIPKLKGIDFVEGKLEQSNGGTLFLAEIGELPVTLQLKLLRILNEMEFERVGGTKSYQIDVRFIVSTSKNLQSEVDMGNFRDALLYRLNVIKFDIPPLRKNQLILPAMIHYIINHYCIKYQQRILTITPDAMYLLMKHNWPGNIFELENIIERAIMVCHDNCITVSDISIPSKPSSWSSLESIDKILDVNMLKEFTLPELLEHIEKSMILRALKKSNQMQVRAAEILGITKSLIQYKMKKYNIPLKLDLNSKPLVLND
jgi:two-component system, NtrC family, response regulator